MPESARQIGKIAIGNSLRAPTLAISGGVVGDALARQLEPLSTNLKREAIAETAHIIPEDAPDALLAVLRPSLGID